MASLAQVFSRLRKVSRACLPVAERVSPLILRLVTKLRMAVSELLTRGVRYAQVFNGISGRSSTTSSASLLAWIRATASSRSANPVIRPNTRSNRCLSAVLGSARLCNI